MFSISRIVGGVDPTIAIVKSSAARKADAELRLRYYRDQQSDDTLSLIRARWKNPQDFRIFQVNVCRKITNRRAQVYRGAPFRTFDGWDQGKGDALYSAMSATQVLKKANRLTKLLKTTALKVGWDGESPTLAVVTPNILDVLHDGTPERPLRMIVTRAGETEAETTYDDWTGSTFTRRDWRGNPIVLPGNPDRVNPYGVLPFVPLFDESPDDEFFLSGGDDLIEAQRAINIALANLWRAIEWQSHGQLWVSGVINEGPGRLALGPNTAITLPTDGKAGVLAPNTPIEEVLRAIEFLIKQTAVANDLAANVFELDPKSESGAAKLAERGDLLEAREDDIELWRGYENRLFEVVKRVVNTHRPGTIPESATVRVDFAEVRAETDDAARLEGYQRRLDMGIWSPVDVMLADNPDVRTREGAIKIIQQRADEAVTLGVGAFAGPGGVST